jgi:uncharacterized sulfatase
VTRPNIVWISTHDINPHLSTYDGLYPGAGQVHTPRIDRLAEEGTRYDLAFSAAPVCAPSRWAIMTGTYPIAAGTMHMRSKAVPPAEVTLVSELLRAEGYYTTNNWFTDFQIDTPPTAFDECSPTAHWRNRPEGAPFFAAFHSLITHESRVYRDHDYDAAMSRVPDQVRHRPEEVELPPYHPDTPVFRQAWARYLDLIESMDDWVGEILDQLDEDGLARDTLVVFWADHGAGLPRAKRWATEAGLRVPLIVRWGGRVAPGEARHEVVELVDLAPTMLSAAGVPVPEHMQGRPLFSEDGDPLPLSGYAFGARDRMDDQEDAARTVRDERFRYTLNLHPDRSPLQYSHYPDHMATWSELRRLRDEEIQAIATGRVPTAMTAPQRALTAATKPEEELYDLVDDPYELRNLVAEPAYADVRARLRGALDAWRSEVGDLGALAEEDLIESWRPGGVWPITSAPVVSIEGGYLTASCETPGSSIAWTTVPPGETPERAPLEATTGAPLADGRRWKLYTSPVPQPSVPVWFGAWRLGYAPSPEVER